MDFQSATPLFQKKMSPEPDFGPPGPPPAGRLQGALRIRNLRKSWGGSGSPIFTKIAPAAPRIPWDSQPGKIQNVCDFRRLLPVITGF